MTMRSLTHENMLILRTNDPSGRAGDVDYRGIDRLPPNLGFKVELDDPLNAECLWYLEDDERKGYATDVNRLRRLASSYRKARPSERLDVLEIAQNGILPTIGRRRMGHDVTDDNLS